MTLIGIVGMGSIGKRHYDNFKVLGCTVAGYDPNIDMWKGGLAKDCLQDCDGIVIAAPSSHHAEYIDWFNNKPLFVEKPVVMTREQANRMLGITRIKMVGYNLRFHSSVKAAKRWMGKGLIGKPLWARFICAQFNDKPAYRRDGVVLNWSHEIDLALHLLGPAEVKNSVVEDEESYANINLMHKNTGCKTNIHLDYITVPERRGFTIVGDRGSITADLVQRQVFMLDINGVRIGAYIGADSFDLNYLLEDETFLRLLRGQTTRELYCTAQQAIDVVDICCAAKELASI